MATHDQSRRVNRNRLPGDPAWFNVANDTPLRFIRSARAGRHPLGKALTTKIGATCGSCKFSGRGPVGRSYYSCKLIKAMYTLASWPGCEDHQDKGNDNG